MQSRTGLPLAIVLRRASGLLTMQLQLTTQWNV